MKEIVWHKTQDRMIIDTGHKTFDRQTNLISNGNIIANTQFGWHVRPFNETRCNGRTWEPGHLRDFDLRSSLFDGIPSRVRKYILDNTIDEGLWVNRFFHYNEYRRITHGWVMVRDGKIVAKFYTGPTWKSYNVVDEAALYVGDLQ